MKYVGSKNRISKELAPIIQSYITEDTKGYLEPFVGGANMIDKIKHYNRIGCDIHKELIALLNKAKNDVDSIPDEISEEEYKMVKNNKSNYEDWLDFVLHLVLSILGDMLGLKKGIEICQKKV